MIRTQVMPERRDAAVASVARSTLTPATATRQAADLLVLQRHAGNRATRALVGSPAQAGPHRPVAVQRARNVLVPLYPPSVATAAEMLAFATWLDGLVAQAHAELTGLQLTNWAAANEPQIDTFLTGWANHVATPVLPGATVPVRVPFMAAWAGTALEAYVCKVLMPTAGAPRPYVLQRHHGTTIVDIVATGTDGQEGWFDITCNVGHVLDKTSWLTRAGTTVVEEITYPPLDFDDMYATHAAGVRLTRQRLEMLEAAKFIKGENARKETKAKKTIRDRWANCKNVEDFAAQLRVTPTQAKKVLYYGGVDKYPAGGHPKSAKHDGRILWERYGW